MSSESEYRHWAADCLDLGKRAAELTDRTRLLVIAEAWLELADRIGRANRRPARQTIDNTVAEHPLVTNAFGSDAGDVATARRAGALRPTDASSPQSS
jgi:hypothetical protein